MTISSSKTLLAAVLASVLTWGCGIEDEQDQDLGRTSSALTLPVRAPISCGNGVCDGYYDKIKGVYIKETQSNCPQDCGWCGNGKVDPGERCDPAAHIGRCPTVCQTSTQTCMQYVLKDGGTCQARCVLEEVVPCCGNGECEWNANAGGFFVSGEKNATCAEDCYCGNGTLDPEEICDKAILSGDGACPTSCPDTQVLVGSKATCTSRCTIDDGDVGGDGGGGGGDDDPLIIEGKNP